MQICKLSRGTSINQSVIKRENDKVKEENTFSYLSDLLIVLTKRT
ncbi:MAG TPA: hypothetical protein VHJ38_19480 [Nitrososphaeraceae archaeon]|nr:hypothetical protein [Nitrososphaeraceae archaeon]